MSSLSLANPLLAAGVLGVAAPIIIHFIFRRRSRIVDFPAMRYVILSYKKVARRLLIQEYLLLAARCLMVALLAMALAGPLIARMVSGFKRGDKPLAVAFVVDNSLSMTRARDGQSLFAAAQQRVREWLSQTAEGDRLTLIDASRLVATDTAANAEAIRKDLADLTPTSAPAHLNEALSLAAARLADFPASDRMILVFTDLQRTSWLGPAEAKPNLPPVFLINLADQLEPKNLAVTDVQIKRKTMAREETAEIVAAVKNFGAQPVNGALLRVAFGDKVAAQGFVDLPAGEAVEKSLVLTETPNGAGAVRLEADDGLPGDNQAWFHLKGGQEVAALLVDGSPGAGYLESETYFLDHALNPRLYARSRVKPRTVTVPEFDAIGLADYQVVVLANVEKLEPAAMDKLKAFVDAGGGLLITTGDNVNADNYNAMFGPLLPRELRGAKLSNAGAQAGGEVRPMRLESPALDADAHPILAVFKDPSQGDLGLAEFRKYFLVQQEVVPKSRVILRLTDGTPIMVEARVGRGDVILLTSSADKAWNDLCIHPTYLPLMQQTVQYLAGALVREDAGRLYAGAILEIPAPPDVVGGRVMGPDGRVSACELIEEIGARRLRIGRADLPGVYYLQYKRAGLEPPSGFDAATADKIMVVNVDPGESDLEAITVAEIQNRTGAPKVRLLAPDQPMDPDVSAGLETKPYAGVLLWLLALTAVFERALTRR
jgi:hypothetical protein